MCVCMCARQRNSEKARTNTYSPTPESFYNSSILNQMETGSLCHLVWFTCLSNLWKWHSSAGQLEPCLTNLLPTQDKPPIERDQKTPFTPPEKSESFVVWVLGKGGSIVGSVNTFRYCLLLHPNYHMAVSVINVISDATDAQVIFFVFLSYKAFFILFSFYAYIRNHFLKSTACQYTVHNTCTKIQQNLKTDSTSF